MNDIKLFKNVAIEEKLMSIAFCLQRQVMIRELFDERLTKFGIIE